MTPLERKFRGGRGSNRKNHSWGGGGGGGFFVGGGGGGGAWIFSGITQFYNKRLSN